MVSVTSSETEFSTSTIRHNRGFIPEESAVAVGPGFGPVMIHYRPFWRPVVGGSLVALSIFVLSWYLMLGCHVGVTEGGLIALGAGAAVWTCVTSCVAFYFGGLLAGTMSATRGPRWLKGAAIWGLSIPLALVVYGIAAQSGVLLGALDLPRAGLLTAGTGTMGAAASFGFFWSAFIALACGLVFAIAGSVSGYAYQTDTDDAYVTGSDGH